MLPGCQEGRRLRGSTALRVQAGRGAHVHAQVLDGHSDSQEEGVMANAHEVMGEG